MAHVHACFNGQPMDASQVCVQAGCHDPLLNDFSSLPPSFPLSFLPSLLPSLPPSILLSQGPVAAYARQPDNVLPHSEQSLPSHRPWPAPLPPSAVAVAAAVAQRPRKSRRISFECVQVCERACLWAVGGRVVGRAGVGMMCKDPTCMPGQGGLAVHRVILPSCIARVIVFPFNYVAFSIFFSDCVDSIKHAHLQRSSSGLKGKRLAI